MGMLGSQELMDLLGPLMAEEDEKRIAYEEIKGRVDKMMQEYFEEKYGVKKGEEILDAQSGARIRLEQFIVDKTDDDGKRLAKLQGRPFIFGRPIHPFGLGKPKKYFPADWITKGELEDISEKS